MKTTTARVVAAAAAASLALLAAGCAGNATPATGTNTSPVSATSRALPSPFTITARYSAASLGLKQPQSLAVGPDGNLYVTDLSKQVTVISPAGKVLRRWTRQGDGHVDFAANGGPTGKIAAGPDGNLYVSDSKNGRVQVYTPQGRFLRQFGSYGSGKGHLLTPLDLMVDRAGNVYVTDDQAGTLSKFSAAGQVIWTIGGSASSDPDLNGHFHLASIDAHGRLVVVNDGRQQILYIDPSGHKVDAFGSHTGFSNGNGACEATVDVAGNTYVSGCGPGPTMVYDRAHRLIAKWPGTPYSLLRSPAFGPRGEVFALATDGTILKLHITVPGA
jgi:DNA-binding beta-propeller fold protein YncE